MTSPIAPVHTTSVPSPGSTIGLVFLPALLVAAVGLALYGWFRSQGLDVAGAFQEWHYFYYFFLPAALVLALPFLLRGLRRRDVALGQQWLSSKTLLGDVAVGVLAAVLGLVVAVVYVRMTHLSLPPPDHLPDSLWRILVLVVIAPPIKEIAFRLYPVVLLEPRLGVLPAYLIGTTAFAIIDWQNLGASFVAGTVWYLAYRWRRRLIVPTIAHALTNLITILLG